MYSRILFLVIGFLIAVTSPVFSQSFVEKITDFFEFEVRGKDWDSTRYTTKIVTSPIVTYEPATNLALGVGAKFLFKPKGAGEDTRTSNVPLSASYTLNNQFIFFSEYNIFFPEEKWLLKGDLIISKYPVSYYGIGSNTVEANEVLIGFDQVLFQPLLLRKVKNNWFAGGGIRYNRTFNPRFPGEENTGMNSSALLDSLNTTSAGLEMALTLDSRDNILNALSGNFLEFSHGLYDERWGASHSFMLSRFDYRKYIRLSPNRLDVLALNAFARLAWADAPLLEYSSLGGGELLRGFQEGRFRDRLSYFVQAEYRWQTFERIGFVFFAGAGDVVNNINSINLDNVKYSLGTGFRLKIVKSENLNIRLDYAFGFGQENDNNFYLGLAEAF